jgi:hypothetical protein
MPTLIDIDAQFGLSLPLYECRIGGFVFQCNPDHYRVGDEIAYARFRQREVELLREGQIEQARSELIELAARIVGRDNPDWTAERLSAELSVRQIGPLLRFFDNPALYASLAEQTTTPSPSDQLATSPGPQTTAPSSVPTASTIPTTPAPRAARRRTRPSSAAA